VLSSYETLEKQVQVYNHLEGEEKLTEERSLRSIAIVDGVEDACPHANEVDD